LTSYRYRDQICHRFSRLLKFFFTVLEINLDRTIWELFIMSIKTVGFYRLWLEKRWQSMVTGTVTGQKLEIYCTILVTPNRPKLTANTPFASVCLQVLDRFFLISVRRFLQAFASVYKRLRSFTSIFLVQRSRDNINERFSNAACAVCFGQLVP